MMQSILLSGPSAAPSNESSSAAAVESETESDLPPIEKDKSGEAFSLLLDSVIEGQGNSEGEIETELAADELLEEVKPNDEMPQDDSAEINNEEQLSEELPQLDAAVETDQSAASGNVLQQSRETLQSDLEAGNLTAVSAEDKITLAGDMKNPADSQEAIPGGVLAGTAVNNADKNSNPILAQIEAAQKIDTKITAAQKAVQAASESSELSNEVKKGAGKEDKEQLKAVFSSAEDAGKSMQKNSTDDLLSAEMSARSIDKSEPFAFMHKNDAERNFLTNSVENSPLRAAASNVSSLDKLINHNTQEAQSALQKPLELHSKHASALLGERIMMMIGQGKQEIQIRLDPAELGSMHIKLQVQQDQVQLHIQTQVGQSRDLIEQNLPRLREQLAQQGISLGDTSVEQNNQQQSQNQQAKDGVINTGGAAGSELLQQETGDNSQWIPSKIPLPAQGIDYYA
ncbi:flagellar hook-length control protein FliK [Psychromonas ossibalaenae]|uniref:flagellar hook-length control protein FliK n=1 Tax=Psychromonas ossibalaenae TaxID=444922 RepID=UPI00037ADF36|nr:flagellar hook-length control protein FliK [Psychromonas ossibalaenae]